MSFAIETGPPVGRIMRLDDQRVETCRHFSLIPNSPLHFSLSSYALLCFQFYIHRNASPLSLLEANHTQRAPRRVTDQNRDPDVDRVQSACLPDHKADAEGHDNLRDDRDVERAPGVTSPLQSARVG